MTSKRNFLTLHDRVRRNGECFRPAERLEQSWVLFHVIKGVMVEDDPEAWHLSDKRQQQLRDGKLIAVDENFFSTAAQHFTSSTDDSDLNDLTDAEMRTIAWKVEWCTRFNVARAGLDGHGQKPSRTPKGLDAFIEREREAIHRWYLDTFKMTRPPGRCIAGQVRKVYDYPSGTTLREWLSDYEDAEFKKRAFKPGYGECGHRKQLDERLLEIIKRNVDAYASRALPTKDDVFQQVDSEIEELNRYLPEHAKLSVNERSIRRRIDELPPMFVDAGRLGLEVAGRKYTSVGRGLQTYDGLERIERMGRIEMDDWEMDLFAILDEPEVNETLSSDVRKAAKEVDRTVRCTVTVGIDIVTRCVVALNVTHHKPSPAGSRRALDTMFIDKTGWAKLAKATTDWPMHGTPREIATDGGPAFTGDFRDSVARLGITQRYPGGNPTTRAHIESFFKNLKRFCRLFTGQTFANVVMKGDYPAEELASLFAHELELLIVRFIVDEYHQKAHSGLSGLRPYTAWERSQNELIAPPTAAQRHAAFGVRMTDLRIQKSGITFMHVQYKHPKMGILYGLVGRRDLTGIVNPNDLGTMLVLIPKEAQRVLDGHGDYMEFKADGFSGVPLSRVEHFNDEINGFADDEGKKGRSVRHEARRELKRVSEEARIRAGKPSDTMSNEQWLRFFGRMDRAGERAARARPQPQGAPMSDADEPDTLGRSIARPVGARPLGKPGTPDVPPAPRRSINRYRNENPQ